MAHLDKFEKLKLPTTCDMSTRTCRLSRAYDEVLNEERGGEYVSASVYLSIFIARAVSAIVSPLAALPASPSIPATAALADDGATCSANYAVPKAKPDTEAAIGGRSIAYVAV